ncbi:MAG: CoA pyrophosphatase [Flavobacteriales bacterium]|nr:CoA pyrophosphatase [Flavobacteriales bacterium]
MNLAQLERIFNQTTEENLPKWNSHKKIIPFGREYLSKTKIRERNPKIASVLILLYEENDIVYFPLIQRSSYDGVHSGQVALPGGKYESFDVTTQETAKRETFEEIGIPKKDSIIIGSLSEMYVEVSNYLIFPYVAKVDNKVDFIIDKKEVEKVFSVSVSELISAQIIQKRVDLKNYNKLVPCYIIKENLIWGATAMILQEFKDIMLNGKAEQE